MLYSDCLVQSIVVTGGLYFVERKGGNVVGLQCCGIEKEMNQQRELQKKERGLRTTMDCGWFRPLRAQQPLKNAYLKVWFCQSNVVFSPLQYLSWQDLNHDM